MPAGFAGAAIVSFAAYLTPYLPTVVKLPGACVRRVSLGRCWGVPLTYTCCLLGRFEMTQISPAVLAEQITSAIGIGGAEAPRLFQRC